MERSVLVPKAVSIFAAAKGNKVIIKSLLSRSFKDVSSDLRAIRRFATKGDNSRSKARSLGFPGYILANLPL